MTVIWSNAAFKIYMGDALGREPEAFGDRDVMLAEASLDRDVMITNAARDRDIEDAAAREEAIAARRSGAQVTRGARG